MKNLRHPIYTQDRLQNRCIRDHMRFRFLFVRTLIQNAARHDEQPRCLGAISRDDFAKVDSLK